MSSYTYCAPCMGPGSPLAEDEAEALGYRDIRSELLDGIPSVPANAMVPQSTRNAIAVARTAVLWALLGATGVGAYFTKSAVLTDAPTVARLPLGLRPCGANVSELVAHSTGAEPTEGLQEILEREEHKEFHFVPMGAAVSEWALPELRYFESEELWAEPPQYFRAYSLWLLGREAVTFNVTLSGDTGCLAGATKDHVADLFGDAVTRQLKAAERREPRAAMPTTPMAHGAVMLRMDSGRMWSASLSKFDQPYYPSQSMNLRSWLVLALQVSIVALGVLVFGRAGFEAWWKATAVWVVQYDFLWVQADLHHSGPYGQIDPSHVVHRRSLWKLANACGVFWVLDHIVGDPQTNDERWSTALGSAVVHGLFMAGVTALPGLHASFWPEWHNCCFALVIAHVVLCMLYGASYYWSVPFLTRRPLYYGSLATTSVLLVSSAFYFVGVLLFMSTRLVVMPKQAVAIVGSLGALVLYIVVVSTGLMRLRESIQQRAEGKSTKGRVISKLRSSGLDVKSIIATVALSSAILLLFVGLMLVSCMLYSDHNGIGQVVASVVGALSSMAGAAKQLQGKAAAVSRVENAVDDVL